MADRTDRAELPERLRDAARSHRPDRERMLARVERAMHDQATHEQALREQAVAGRPSAEHTVTGPVTGPAAGPAAPGESGPGQEGAADPAPWSVRGRRFATRHGGRRPDEPRPAAPWLRITAVTAAVAGAIGLGGLAVGAVTGDSEPTQTVVTSGGPSTADLPSSSPAGSHAPATHPSSPHTSPPSPRHHTKAATHPAVPPSGARHPAATTPPPSSATTTSGTTGGASAPGSTDTAKSGPLSAHASIDKASNASWTQSDLVLTTTAPLTSLTVELRVARTEGVSSTGSWSTDSGSTAASVAVEGDQLVYRWTLNAGQTLAPGSHTFSGQFNHARGDRDAGGDTYTAQAQGPDGASSVGGGF